MFFIDQESLLSVIAECRQQSRVNEMPVKALRNVKLAAGSYHQPGQITLLPQLPNARERGKSHHLGTVTLMEPFLIYSPPITHSGIYEHTQRACVQPRPKTQ